MLSWPKNKCILYRYFTFHLDMYQHKISVLRNTYFLIVLSWWRRRICARKSWFLVVRTVEQSNVNEIRGKIQHGLPSKFPTRRARVLFTDELSHVLLIRIVDYELRAWCTIRTDVATITGYNRVITRNIGFFDDTR